VTAPSSLSAGAAWGDRVIPSIIRTSIQKFHIHEKEFSRALLFIYSTIFFFLCDDAKKSLFSCKPNRFFSQLFFIDHQTEEGRSYESAMVLHF
jgi:hypothetical protein